MTIRQRGRVAVQTQAVHSHGLSMASLAALAEKGLNIRLKSTSPRSAVTAPKAMRPMIESKHAMGA